MQRAIDLDPVYDTPAPDVDDPGGYAQVRPQALKGPSDQPGSTGLTRSCQHRQVIRGADYDTPAYH